jgi:hypothetical protein
MTFKQCFSGTRDTKTSTSEQSIHTGDSSDVLTSGRLETGFTLPSSTGPQVEEIVKIQSECMSTMAIKIQLEKKWIHGCSLQGGANIPTPLNMRDGETKLCNCKEYRVPPATTSRRLTPSRDVQGNIKDGYPCCSLLVSWFTLSRTVWIPPTGFPS